jgi:hypothetical protein
MNLSKNMETILKETFGRVLMVGLEECVSGVIFV